ncbi:hypothetical protein [Burkholderia sp. AU32262]|uniref:hypothetical protein n=1 Tax=Burkholderia sp. AU32262 TaxID=2879630 RepID=UPI001CF54399|nr:hypothetical protein [Burkholderia sp. AU32262]MCA8239847.1 hypothetical protein [Burkholderia sp. AU32262]
MTVPVQNPIVSYVGNGITTEFAFDFKILNSADLKVMKNGFPQFVGTHFSINGIGEETGGSVVFNVAPLVGDKLIIYRTVARRRDVDYQDNGDLLADTVNADFDRIWMALQDGGSNQARAIQYPVTEYTTDGTLPVASERGLKLLGFDDLGGQTMVPIPASVGAGDLKNEVWIDGVDFTAGTSDRVRLSRLYTTKANLGAVIMVGVTQDPDSYSLSGYDLIFDAPIPLGVGKIWCYGGTTLSLNTPADQSVTAPKIQQARSGKWFAEDGALINRMADRLLLGDAVANDGTLTGVASQSDWLSEFQIATGLGFGQVQFTQQSVLTTQNPDSLHAATFASRTVNANQVRDFQGINAYLLNDSPSYRTNGWAIYGEAHQLTSQAGATYACELDVRATTAYTAVDPYSALATQVVALQLGSGVGIGSTQQDTSAAINIQNNLSKFGMGINFGATALRGANGSSGTATALGMARGHSLQWFGSAGVKSSAIRGYATTTAMELAFFDGYTNIQNANGVPAMQFSENDTAANYLIAGAANAGASPVISVNGSDANIDIALIPKGTGMVAFGTYSASSLAVTGYIPIRDSGGTVRRLLVG